MIGVDQSRMKALVCVGLPDLVELQDVPACFHERGEALVRVEAVSVNRGELHRLRTPTNVGWRPGWDFAGVVERAPGGTVPVGSRVYGMTVEGSWAERVSVPVGQLALVPDAADWTAAAALPVAGLTALRTLRLRGDLAGQHVLVLGAAGGVGRIAVQLAHRAGAHVTAVVSGPGRADGMRELGADKVVWELDNLRHRYDVILESVGGPALATSFGLAATGGTIVCFGNSSQQQTKFDIGDLYPKQATVRGFYLLYDIVRHPPSADLSHLMDLHASGQLVIDVAAVAHWSRAREVLDDLAARRLAGKAVLLTRDRQPAGHVPAGDAVRQNE